MRKRGKVLRDTCAGPGLLMIEGQQYRLPLGGIWKSELAPKPGLVVDVELDRNLQIVAITVVPESQIATEQAKAAASGAGQKGQQILDKLIPDFVRRRLIGRTR